MNSEPIQLGRGFVRAFENVKQSLVGTAVWIAAVIAIQPQQTEDFPWPAAFLLLAALALVPLALGLLTTTGAPSRPMRWACWLQLPAATALAISIAVPSGPLATLLAMPWFLVTLLVALAGAIRLRQRAPGSATDVCVDLSLIYLSIGGGWAVMSRAGLQPLGFDPIIVLLTGVHFHYAGFVLPVLTGLVNERLPGPLATLTSIGVTAGVPLLALGITWSQLFPGQRWLEVGAAWFLAAAGAVVGLQQFALSVRVRPRAAGALLAISGISLLGAMVTAAIYAWGRYRGVPTWTIPQMLPVHGALNAIGFALCGLWGWSVSRLRSNACVDNRSAGNLVSVKLR